MTNPHSQTSVVKSFVLLASLFFASITHADQLIDLKAAALKAPANVPAQLKLADAYLADAQLDNALKAYKKILALNPNHTRAKRIVERLSLPQIKLDAHLQILTRIIESNPTKDIVPLLDTASAQARSSSHRAQILYLKGLLALKISNLTLAQTNFTAASKLYPNTTHAGLASIQLAKFNHKQGHSSLARSTLATLASSKTHSPEVTNLALLELTFFDNQPLSPSARAAALKSLSAKLTDPTAKRIALTQLLHLTRLAAGRWTPDAVTTIDQLLNTNPSDHQLTTLLTRLKEIVAATDDRQTLQKLLTLLNKHKFASPALNRSAQFTFITAALNLAALAPTLTDMKPALQTAQAAVNRITPKLTSAADRARLQDLRGQIHLIDGQKHAALNQSTLAVAALIKAKNHYLNTTRANPDNAFTRLNKIASLLEHLHEWETAASVYRDLALQHPQNPHAAEALFRVAHIYEHKLDAPIAAINAYVHYASRYPAELPYRRQKVGLRLKRLGYANVVDFQKKNNLKPDGLFGPTTQSKLKQLEQKFDLIRVRPSHANTISVRGRFVHPTIFAIAKKLQNAGHHRKAIHAYRTFLNLYPTKKDADDALFAIARMFRENHLFHEAIAAYQTMIDDYPNGNMTSDAYILAAACLENLGQWKAATNYYQLYIKKFPRYKFTALCKSRITDLNEISQYQDFITNHPTAAKVAEAQYQIGVILYKRIKNYTRAAIEFEKVASKYPKHIRASEGLFSAATAQLWAQNFPDARRLAQHLVKTYPDSRLADDAQFWIGHTYEYRARALGKLDAARIMIKRRALHSRKVLIADLTLRKQYNPNAKATPIANENIWGADTLNLLAAGPQKDRVNRDLFNAIAAYKQVTQKFKTGDMAGRSLLRVGAIYTQYLNDPDKGIAAYQLLLQHYPGTPQARDALYAVGDHFRKNKQLDKAINAYQKFVYNFPRDKQVQEAMIQIARCHAEKKSWDKALDAYQRYLNKYPKGKHTDVAKTQVQWIRTYHF